MDPEGWAIGDWSAMTPKLMRGYTEEFLNYVSEQNGGGRYDTWARAELARRQNETLKHLLARIGDITTELETATTKTHAEVAMLNASSTRMETLTIRLKTFTIWLMVFAGIQIVIAGLQTWKMFQSEPQLQTAPVFGHPEPYR